MGVRLARRADGRPARGGHHGRPRHRHRLTAAVADAPPPRDAAGDPGRAHAVARRAPVLLPQLARLPRARPGAVHPDGRALPRPPGARPVARLQRARLPQRPLLLRHQRCGVPHVAAPPVRRRRGAAQRRVGHGVLVAALRRLRAGAAATGGAHPRQPHPAARLRALQLRPAARQLRRRARRAAPALPRRAGDDQLHGDAADTRHGLPALGPRARRRVQRPLPHRRGGRRPPRACVQRRPHPRHG